MIARYVRQAPALFVALVVPAAAFVVPAAAPAAGRDPVPAFRLPDTAAPERYEARLEIDPRSAEFSGVIDIALRMKRDAPVLWLNATSLSLERVEARQGAREVKVEVVPGGQDFVGLRGAFAAGPASVRIAYRGKVDALAVEGIFRQQERGEWYALSQFQAIGARRAFPCFDEPGWKTPWRLTIDAPERNVVVSNTPQVAASRLESRPGWWRHEFLQTRPLPTYLVALAVGPFDVVDGGLAGAKNTPLRYLTPRGRGAEARYAAAATPRLLEMLEAYFGTPYPFEKLDSIVIPQLVTFAAMENVGLITYGSQWMLARPHEETTRFREIYAGLAAHEMAHMWFGNLVTLAWWDDTWLNEAFASWIATKVAYGFQPAWDNGDYRNQTRNAALEADRLATARRIRNPVESRNAIDDAFDDITYNKGEEVLSMFEAWLGPERFRAGVRRFLERHAWGSARSDDFFHALGEVAGDAGPVLRGLRAAVDQPGAPLIDARLACESAPELRVAQSRLRPRGSTAGELEWITPVCLRYRAGAKEATQCAPVDAATRRIALAAGECPSWIVGNAGGGHYVVRYEKALLERNAGRFASIPSFEAQVLASDTLLLAESGLVPLADALVVAEAALGHGAPLVEAAGVRVLERLRDEWLGPAERAEKARIVAQRVMPRARELGWVPRSADSDEVRTLRADLLAFAAQRPEGATLRPEARRLALAWLDDRLALDATVVASVLDAAGRFADATTFARLQAAALDSDNQRERRQLLGALARARDPGLRARALSLALDRAGTSGRIDGRSALTLLSAALQDDANRAAAFDYVRANAAALEEKLPKDTMAFLLPPMGRLCTAAQREALAEAFRERAPRYMTGELRYRQALESIELCIAARGS